MDKRGCNLGAWDGRILLEEDEVKLFGSLNVNFNCCSTLDSLKRDFGIYIAIGLFSFLFDDLESTSLMMDFGTHTFLVFFFLDISFEFMPPCWLEETWWSYFLNGFFYYFIFLYWKFKLLPKELGLLEEEAWYDWLRWVTGWKWFKDKHLHWSWGKMGGRGM